MNKFLIAVAVTGCLISCNAPSQTVSSAGTLPPVETKAPNTPAYKPAFAGQTRVAGVKTQTPIDVKIISIESSFRMSHFIKPSRFKMFKQKVSRENEVSNSIIDYLLKLNFCLAPIFTILLYLSQFYDRIR